MVVATLSKEQFKEVTYLVESTLSGVQQNSKSNYYASFLIETLFNKTVRQLAALVEDRLFYLAKIEEILC